MVGKGRVAIYLSVLVSFTFYVRKQIGTRAWRVIHMLSYGLFGLALLHGVFAGTTRATCGYQKCTGSAR